MTCMQLIPVKTDADIIVSHIPRKILAACCLLNYASKLLMAQFRSQHGSICQGLKLIQQYIYYPFQSATFVIVLL